MSPEHVIADTDCFNTGLQKKNQGYHKSTAHGLRREKTTLWTENNECKSSEQTAICMTRLGVLVWNLLLPPVQPFPSYFNLKV